MFTHIRAASLTLQNVLERSFRADPGLALMFDPSLGGTAIVSLATPDGMEAAGDIGLSMWLYRLVRDEQTLNRPPRRISPTLTRRQPLPVRAHYLMTPIVTGSAKIRRPRLTCFHSLEICWRNLLSLNCNRPGCRLPSTI